MIVQPRSADEFVVDARQPRRRQVVGHQIGAENVTGIDAGLLGDVADERPCCAAGAPHRVDVALWIQRERLAVLGQVDGQLRHAQDRVVDADQPVRDTGAVPHRQSPADAEVAVQPRVQPGTPVGLQRDHLPPHNLTVGMLLDPQVGAVGMTADDPKRPTAGVVRRCPRPPATRPAQ